MISDAFILLGLGILNLLFGVLPEGEGYPDFIVTAFSGLGSAMGVVNIFVPIEAVAVCFGIWYGYDLAVFAFKQTAWIFSKIPIIGK